MKENSVTDIDALLKHLAAYKRQKAAEEYAKTYFAPHQRYIEHSDEEMDKEMAIINCVVDSLFPSDFATLIHLHYVNDIPLEKCAECMYISRATAYRLLKRAHIAVNKRYQRIFKGE